MNAYRYSFYMITLALILTGCHREQKVSLPGYLDAKYTYVSASFSGILQSLHTQAGDQVKKNQSLFTLESLPESADLQAAKARLQEAKDLASKTNAEFSLRQSDFNRRQHLFKKAVISKEEFESSQASYLQVLSQVQSNKANLAAKEADVEKSSWAAQQKTIASPITSTVFDVYYSQGEFIPAGRPVLSLLENNNLKVIFFIPEENLSQIHLNQAIEINCDNCHASFSGKVSYISTKAEFTPPVIYSTEEKAKLVYRVEAIPQMQDATNKLNSGQPITVTFMVKNHA
ncbi:MAG: efflux RND transporter periplasmic adaptor subunit [Gammaproteobacteria bacterium]